MHSWALPRRWAPWALLSKCIQWSTRLMLNKPILHLGGLRTRHTVHVMRVVQHVVVMYDDASGYDITNDGTTESCREGNVPTPSRSYYEEPLHTHSGKEVHFPYFRYTHAHEKTRICSAEACANSWRVKFGHQLPGALDLVASRIVQTHFIL